MSDHSKAYIEGYSASFNKIHMSKNPYARGSWHDNKDWNVGWMDALCERVSRLEDRGARQFTDPLSDNYAAGGK